MESDKINLGNLPTGRYILKVRLKGGGESNHAILVK